MEGLQSGFIFMFYQEILFLFKEQRIVFGLEY